LATTPFWYKFDTDALPVVEDRVLISGEKQELNAPLLLNFLVPIANGALIGSAISCGVDYGMLRYQGSINTLNIGTFKRAINGCIPFRPAVSADGKNLAYFNYRNFSLTRSNILGDGTLAIQAQLDLELNQNIDQIVLANDKKLIFKMSYEDSYWIRVYDENLTDFYEPYIFSDANPEFASQILLSSDNKIGMVVALGHLDTKSVIKTFSLNEIE
jgi:hypothetical protein